MQVSKSKGKNVHNVEDNKEKNWVTDEQFQMDDHTCGIETSKRSEDENFNNDYSKFPSETCSSDVTQSTPIEAVINIDDSQAPFASDEANSSGNMYPFGADFTNLLQDIQIPGYSSLQYQLPYPPLELEDFPQINIAKSTKPELTDEYMTYKDCMNGTLEEIFSLCSSQDYNSNATLSMQD
ncbi:hypothetical protein M5689_010310 [Euphorbia peplus]|nr:hypothetical protein M5689_010310 [Euphorbia peplus]